MVFCRVVSFELFLSNARQLQLQTDQSLSDFAENLTLLIFDPSDLLFVMFFYLSLKQFKIVDEIVESDDFELVENRFEFDEHGLGLKLVLVHSGEEVIEDFGQFDLVLYLVVVVLAQAQLLQCLHCFDDMIERFRRNVSLFEEHAGKQIMNKGGFRMSGTVKRHVN